MKYLIFTAIVLSTFFSSIQGKLSRVYHPYVIPLERELEYRTLLQDTKTSSDLKQLQLLGYGQSFNENLFLEFYLISENTDGESAEISAYEVEALIQLTEQGEFWADWGLVFELEKVDSLSIWEVSSGVIIEKEWGRWSTTANLFVIYEFGDDYDEEWHTAAALQLRYRHSRFIEPSLELFSSEYGSSIGPGLGGQLRFGLQKLNWEVGLQLALDNDAPDTYWRFLIDFEF
jgi:hypothetical protein